MDKFFFIKRFFLPVAIFSLAINVLLLTPTVYMLQLQDRVIAAKSEETLWLLTGLLCVALVVVGVMEVVRSRILVTANNAIDVIYAPYLLRKMLESASGDEDERQGYLLSDLQTVRSFLTGASVANLFDAPWLPLYAFLLYFMNPLLFFIMIVGSALMFGLTLATEYVTKRPLATAGASSRMASRFVDLSLRNSEVVGSMGMIDSIVKRWLSLNNHVLWLQTQAGVKSGTISGVSKALRQLFQALAMGTGTYIMLKDPTFSMGMMIAGGIIYGKALGPLEFVISGWKGMTEARTAYRRLERFMERAAKQQQTYMELPPPTGQITLEHVTFGIRSLNKVILRDISFSLEPGDILGVIGPSASGKSTLSRLLVGVWKPLQGTIRLDGADINNWPPERLGKYLGYLPQDIELFSGTVAENIARLEQPDSERVITAARLAGLHDLILHLPNGYDTQIGEGGTFLSGGQRQRIGLARTLYGNPRIVVLDEPNSNLDTEGEAALMATIDALKQAGVTTIVVTHNANYLNKVEKLLVLQYGSLAAFGPKEWVLARLKKARQGNNVQEVTASSDAADDKVTSLPKRQ